MVTVDCPGRRWYVPVLPASSFKRTLKGSLPSVLPVRETSKRAMLPNETGLLPAAMLRVAPAGASRTATVASSDQSSPLSSVSQNPCALGVNQVLIIRSNHLPLGRQSRKRPRL